MVFLTIPPILTEEEELLQQKYVKLRKKKKALAALKIPKVEKQETTCESLKRPAEAAADATEQAKKLLKLGAIKVGPDRREQQTFKRSKRQKETDKPIGFHPFTQSGTCSDNQEEKLEVVRSKQKFNVYDNFVSASDSKSDTGEPERPVSRRGNTIYVHARAGLTEELLQTAFGKIGNILNISVETERSCGFVTFEKVESADQAISEVNGAMISGVMLRVSFARRQPPVPPVESASSASTEDSFNPWSCIAASSSQKGAHQDKRDLVTYSDNDDFF